MLSNPFIISRFRGEILEVIDDSRKWWKARNWRGQIAHVPHTIVTELNGGGASTGVGGGRESRGSHGDASPNGEWVRKEGRVGKKGEFRYF